MTKLGITMDVSGIIPGIQAVEHRIDKAIDPAWPDDQIRHYLVKIPYRDESFTKDLTLESILTDCIKYKVFPIININACWWYKEQLTAKMTPAQYAHICRIAADYIKERGFNKATALLSCFNEPGKWLSTAETCQYTNAVQDAVGCDFDVIYGNDEWNMLDWNYLGKNCKAKYMAVHHLSSVGDWGSPYKNFKNIQDAATVAATYGKYIIGSECGSWFTEYCSATGHEVNLDIMAECKKYGYKFCLIVIPHINKHDRQSYKYLGYLVYNDAFTEIQPGSCQDKFNDFMNFIKREGEQTMPGERTIRLTSPAMEGPDVKAIEDKLRELGFDICINSRYESDDYAAARKFQELSKIVIDGVIGPQTKDTLKVTTVAGFYPEVFQDIYQSKHYTAEDIDYWLSQKAITSLTGHGKYFVQAESETGIPAEWQLASGMQESGDRNAAGQFLFGQSYYGREWKNLFGWAITDSGALDQGRFETYRECILKVATQVKNLFLNPANWRYAGDHIFGIEWKYSTAPYNAINKAKYYREITQFLDAGVKTRMPEWIEDLLPILDKYFIRKP